MSAADYFRKKIKQNEKLYFWGRVLQNCRNPEYRQWVVDVTDHPAIARLEHCGERFPDQRFYRIDLDDWHGNSGFFALLNGTVQRLEMADRLGAVPEISWIHTAYSDPEIGRTKNVFEYYFERPCTVPVKELEQAKNVIFSRPGDGFPKREDALYLSLEPYLDEAAALVRKYIRIRLDVAARLEEDFRSLGAEPGTMLGVHVRGTDYFRDLNGHPKAVSFQEYLDKAVELAERYGVSKVFLATDDARAAELFRNALGSRLVLYEGTLRGSGMTGVHYQGAGEASGFRMGYEVLRDVLTLSRCRYFIGGMSQVSLAVRLFNRAYGTPFDEVYLFDKGLNHNPGVTSAKLNDVYFAKKANSEGNTPAAK